MFFRRKGLAPGIPREKGLNGARKAGTAVRADHWDRRVLLAAHEFGKRFCPSDLGPPSMKLVEALHRLVEFDYVDRVALPGCQWEYELTRTGRVEAQRVLDGKSYRHPRPRMARRAHTTVWN